MRICCFLCNWKVTDMFTLNVSIICFKITCFFLPKYQSCRIMSSFLKLSLGSIYLSVFVTTALLTFFMVVFRRKNSSDISYNRNHCWGHVGVGGLQLATFTQIYNTLKHDQKQLVNKPTRTYGA